MTATYNPAEIERLAREGKAHGEAMGATAPACTCNGAAFCEDWCPCYPWAVAQGAGYDWCDANLRAMADQLEAARAEIDRLEAHSGILEFQRDSFHDALTAARARIAELEGGWRAGIEASIRRLEAQQRKPHDLWHAAYFAAIKEAIVHLRAMMARGTERSAEPVAGDD